MTALSGIDVLAHCGATWWACDGGSALAAVVFVVWVVIGLRRLERRTEARAQAHRAARARQMQSTAPEDDQTHGTA